MPTIQPFRSVINDPDDSGAMDISTPISFQRWLNASGIDYNTKNPFIRYQEYVGDWNMVVNGSPAESEATLSLYGRLMKEIFIYHTDNDTKKFLAALDYTNPNEADIAIPFVVKRLKDITAFHLTKRDTLKYRPIQVDISGTAFGIEKTVFNIVLDHIKNNSSNIDSAVEYFKNNFNLQIDEFFDLYVDYYNGDAVTSTDASKRELSSAETEYIEPDMWIDYDKAVRDLVAQYPIILSEIKDERVAFRPNPDNADLSFLENNDFSDSNKNKASKANLILNLKKNYVARFLGADAYHLTTDAAGNYRMGILAKAQTPYANRLNINNATVSIVPSKTRLKNVKELGLPFSPVKQGLLFYRSSDATFEVEESLLTPNTTYVFADPYRFGNVHEHESDHVPVPIIHYTFSYDTVFGVHMGYVSGDIKSTEKDIVLVPYASEEQFQNRAPESSNDNKEWFNSITNRGSVIAYQEDIFGNKYAKIANDPDWTSAGAFAAISRTEHNSYKASDYRIIDGHTFENFDYSVESREENSDEIINRTGLSANMWEGDTTDTFPPNFTPLGKPLSLSFGNFDSDPFPSERQLSPQFLLYDASSLGVNMQLQSLDDPDFPDPKVNYPFSVVIDGGEISDGIAPNLDVDGGWTNEEESDETTFSPFIILPSGAEGTEIETPQEMPPKPEVTEKQTNPGIWYLKRPNGRITIQDEWGLNQICARFGKSGSDVSTIKIFGDIMCIHFHIQDQWAFLRIEMSGEIVTTRSSPRLILSPTEGMFSQPYFSEKNKCIYVAECGLSGDSAASLYAHMRLFRFDTEEETLEQLLDENGEGVLFPELVSEDIPLSTANLPEFSTNREGMCVVSENPDLGIVGIYFPIYDTYRQTYLIVFEVKKTFYGYSLTDAYLTIPDNVVSTTISTEFQNEATGQPHPSEYDGLFVFGNGASLNGGTPTL